MRKIILASALCILASCGGGRSAKNPSDLSTRPFPKVQLPGIVTEPSERTAFVCRHYWDDFLDAEGSFRCDSAYVEGVAKADFEQALSNYVYLLGTLDIQEGKKLMGEVYDKFRSKQLADTAANALESFINVSELYLYDPNSPVRAEDLFQPVAARISQDSLFSQERRDRYAHISAMTSLNCTGTPASDFTFSDKKGKLYTLYGIKADYTVLFFSNPGCKACKEIIETLNASVKVEGLLKTGVLAVVNVYIDENLTEWYEYMSFYPETWYNGYDPNLVIRTDELYNARAIPSLYLLDKDKKVILKDAPAERLFAYLQQI